MGQQTLISEPYRLRVENPADPNQYDEIETTMNDFFHQPWLMARAPENGGTGVSDHVLPIQWLSSHLSGVRIKISLYQGRLFVRELADSVPVEQAEFDWTVDAAPGVYQIRLQNKDDESVQDTSGNLVILEQGNAAGVGWSMYE